MGKLLDLADSSLTAKTKEEKLMAELSRYNNQHILYPPFMGRTEELPALDWNKLSFSPESRKHVPREKGVYAFAVEFEHPFLPPSCHILYIGKAGDVNSNNSLWKRYYDYLRTEKKNDRPRVCQMLRQWKGNLSYYYATVEHGVSTGDIEETLLDILIPPYNRGDFSAELTSLLKEANIL